MNNLIRYELKKFLKKHLVILGFLLVVLYSIICFYSRTIGSTVARINDRSDYKSGIEAIELEKALAQKYGSVLNDKVVQEMLYDFAPSENFLNTSGGVNLAYIVNNSFQQAVDYFFANPDGSWNGSTVYDVFGESELPLGYNEGWISTCEYMVEIFLILCIYIIIAIAPIYSGEYLGVDALLLSSKYGKSKVVKAKSIAAFIFSFTVTCIIVFGNFTVALFLYGKEGLSASILFAFNNKFSEITCNITCGKLVLLLIILAFTSVIIVTSTTLAISSMSKNTYISLVLSLGIFMAPLLFNVSKYNPFYKVLILLPIFQAVANNILSAGTIYVFGNEIMYAWIAIPVSFIIMVVCVIVANKAFSKHQVY